MPTRSPTPEPIAPQPVPFHVNFLWAVNLAWTLILLVMNFLEFSRGGAWTYQGPGSLIYFATLAAYAGVKETHQWAQGADAAGTRNRKGVFFVGVWVVFSMTAFLAVNFASGYVFPHELLAITLQVLGIFFGTQASRALRQGRAKASSIDLEERILQLARAKGGAGTDDMADHLGASRTTVQYKVRRLVAQGKLRKVSTGPHDPDTKYVAV